MPSHAPLGISEEGATELGTWLKRIAIGTVTIIVLCIGSGLYL